jgi:hypothetical protein
MHYAGAPFGLSRTPRPKPPEASGALEPPDSVVAPSAFVPVRSRPRALPSTIGAKPRGAPIHPADCFLLTPLNPIRIQQ